LFWEKYENEKRQQYGIFSLVLALMSIGSAFNRNVGVFLFLLSPFVTFIPFGTSTLRFSGLLKAENKVDRYYLEHSGITKDKGICLAVCMLLIDLGLAIWNLNCLI